MTPRSGINCGEVLVARLGTHNGNEGVGSAAVRLYPGAAYPCSVPGTDTQPFEQDVSVVGLGRVGLPLALSFADRGLDTIGIDKDSERLESVGRA